MVGESSSNRCAVFYRAAVALQVSVDTVAAVAVAVALQVSVDTVAVAVAVACQLADATPAVQVSVDTVVARTFHVFVAKSCLT